MSCMAQPSSSLHVIRYLDTLIGRTVLYNVTVTEVTRHAILG